MRRQRLGLIQTPDQLRFSYIAILQGAIQMLGLENGLIELENDEEEEEEEEEEESESERVGFCGLWAYGHNGPFTNTSFWGGGK